MLNSRAVEVMKRMSDKLMGRDFVVEGGVNPMESNSVATQVWTNGGSMVLYDYVWILDEEDQVSRDI